MKPIDELLVNSNHQRRMRLERKRREFWEDVEFYITEVFLFTVSAALIVGGVWWMLKW